MEFSELLSGCKAKDENAFAEFVKRYSPLILYNIRKKLSIDTDHEDICQQILLKFYQKNLFERFRGENESEFKAYLIRISINAVFDWVKARRDNVVSIDTSDDKYLTIDYDPLKEVLDAEVKADLQQAVAELPLKYRDVINLRLLDYTNQEIADILGRPKSTVETWFSRGCQLLKEKISNFESKTV